MSFKRDGDDSSWLNLLKKRRVEELLAVDIPTDEALLTSNGRFACLVCHYKPVFDNVQMLAIHRNGKKHLAAQEDFNTKKLQAKQRRGPNALLHRPNYDRRMPGKNARKRSGPSIDEDREELERLSRDNEDHLINLKPYRSKCQISSTYVLRRHAESDNLVQSVKPEGISVSESKDSVLETEKQNRIPSEPCTTGKADIRLGPGWTTEKKELYVKSLEAGWKRTPSGEWIRDQDAEFDSDDEPPCI